MNFDQSSQYANVFSSLQEVGGRVKSGNGVSLSIFIVFPMSLRVGGLQICSCLNY